MEREDGSIYEIVRMAPGSQPLATGVQSDYDMAVKGAHTDALKKAATNWSKLCNLPNFLSISSSAD